MTEWKEYIGSDEQIAEIKGSKTGFALRRKPGSEFVSEPIIVNHLHHMIPDATHYLICNPHPLAGMICQQARTGQPVWVKMSSSTYWVIAMRGFDLIYQDPVVSVIKSTLPDWNIPGAEYSFTEFKEEV